MIIAHPALPVSAFSVRHHAHSAEVMPVKKKPPVIACIGGKHPHVDVSLIFGRYPAAVSVLRCRTPRGWVTVRWSEDSGTESGGPVPVGPEPDISRPDMIIRIVVVSPPSLPVYFRGAGDAKWAHLDGHRIPSVETQTVSRNGLYHYTYIHLADPVRMRGGRNDIAVGYPDAE